MTLSGGCLCGSIRYESAAAPERVSHCHCEQCRKATGAVAATFARFERAAVSWQGELARFDSSEFAWREFCPRCGSTLTFNFVESPDIVYIAVGTLDEPARTPAERHSFLSSKLEWLHLDEHLPGSEHWRRKPEAAD